MTNDDHSQTGLNYELLVEDALRSVVRSSLRIVENIGLPESSNEDSPSITIADKRYDGSDLPDSVKAYVSELVRANQNKTNIEYRLRQLDAARITFINTLKASVEESGVSPTEDQE